jgi:hypothetical protein
MLATQMCRRQPQFLTQEIRKAGSRLYIALNTCAVDGE